MRPLLVRVIQEQGVPAWLVPDYRFMLTLAIIAACLLTLLVCRRRGFSRQTAQDLLFWGIPALLVGAKTFYCLQFGWHYGSWREVLSHGFSLYGGLFGLLAAWLVYRRIRHFPLREFLDCATPGLALGLAVGRVGCFLAGCDSGRLCSQAWGVRFPSGSDAFAFQASRGMIAHHAELSLPAHPTQLYEAAFASAVLTVTMLWVGRRPPPGSVFLAGIMSYALYRFATEPIRVDLGGVHPLGWTFASFLSLLVLAGGLLVSRQLLKL